MKEILRSKKIKILLFVLGGIAALLLTFGLGIAVGYHRALFASRFGENYYRNFYGAARGSFGDMAGSAPFNMHGVVGTVIDVSSSTISVKDPGNNERSIAIFPSTVFREDDQTVTIAEVKVGDQITVIGAPDQNGQVEARFIRVVPDPAPEASETNVQK